MGNLLLTLCDQAGITRARLVPASKRASAQTKGLSLSLTTALLLGADDAIADLPAFPAAHGDVRLFPDTAAARVINPVSGLTWAPADQYTPAGEEFPVCQRAILRRQVQWLRGLGLEPVAALEVEFAVYRQHGEEWVLADGGPGYGIRALLQARDWMEELIAACESSGVPLQQIHPEYGRGQYELALGVRDPLTAVDDYVLARILITRVLAVHGLRPSFSPKPEVAAAGNGCHIHLSATAADGSNIFAVPEDGTSFTEVAGHWIGALVDRLPEAVALLASGPHSYARLRPGAFSGAVSCWGPENREAAVRYIPGAAGLRNEGANIEVKVPDCTANPYLAMAALLAIGAHGLESATPLPAPLTVVPSKATDSALAAAHARPLPGSLSEALERLDSDPVLRQALGAAAIDTFIGVRALDLPAERSEDPEALYLTYRWQQ